VESKNYKLAKIFGSAGKEIPAHHVKDESILLVQNGQVILTFNNQIVLLKKNECRVIPAFAIHSIKMSGDFEGLTIMRPQASFEFSLPDLMH
jgi:mannose-6-phosphate isomerase-like protein (cupin superfamily)